MSFNYFVKQMCALQDMKFQVINQFYAYEFYFPQQFNHRSFTKFI